MANNPKIIDAWSKKTGRHQLIPEEWLSYDFAPFTDFTTTDPASVPVRVEETNPAPGGAAKKKEAR